MSLESTPASLGKAAGDHGRGTILRGVFSLTLVGVLTQVINYGIHIGLGRSFAPAVYGYFGIIAATFSLFEIILRSGIQRAVCFFVAQERGVAGEVLQKSLRIQAIYTLACFFLFYSFADRLALVLGDPGLSGYLRFCSFFILTSAWTPIYLGFLNGWGAFQQQAVMATIAISTRLLLVFALLFAGMGLDGVIAAYALSPLPAIVYWMRSAPVVPRNLNGRVQVRAIMTFGFPLFISTLAVSLLMRIDLFMVQSLLEDRFLTGLYASASALIKAPYFLSLGSGLVLFQVVARLGAKDPSELREFISRCVRYYLLGLVPISCILSGAAEPILEITFGREYLPATPVFMILSLCFPFMVLYNVLTIFISALGRTDISMGLGLALLPVELFLIYQWIFSNGLTGVAAATAATFALGAVTAGLYLRRKGYLVFPRWRTLFYVGGASVASYYLVYQISPSGLWVLLFCPLIYFLYLALLVAAGEIGKGEIRALIATLAPVGSSAIRA